MTRRTSRAAFAAVFALAFALPGGVAAGPRAAQPLLHEVKTSIPAPGKVRVTFFTLTLKLRPGATAPRALGMTAVNRTKLPRGVAVVAVVRLVKGSPAGTAKYVGLQAVFRPKTARKTSSATTDEPADVIGAILDSVGIRPKPTEHFTKSVLAWGDDEEDWPRPAPAPAASVANLLDKVTFDTGQGFWWSATRPPAESPKADRIAEDIYKLDTQALDEIETALDVQFDNDFPEGSLTPPAASTAPAAKASYTCKGAQVTLLDSTNGDAVGNGGAPASFSTKGKAYCVTYIQTYHWNDGKGAPPGTLGLKKTSGPAGLPAEIGPFKASASAGQGGAPNVNWSVGIPQSPPAVIDGTYTCEDSSPATWSSNKSSGGEGFCIVQGVPAV